MNTTKIGTTGTYSKVCLLILIISFLSFAVVGSARAGMPSEMRTDSISPVPQYQLIQVKIGFNLGYEFPYSGGIEFSCLFKEFIDVNFGYGLGMSGAKAGFGTRIFPMRRQKLSPMGGVFVYIASGLWDMEVSNNNVKAIYRITPDGAFMVNGGFRFRYGKGQYLIAGIGYSFPFAGEKARYVSGSRDPEMKRSADMFATGGFSLDVGLIIKLSRGSYKKQIRN